MDEMEAWQLRNTIERMTGEVHMLSRQVHDLIQMMQHPMHHYQSREEGHPSIERYHATWQGIPEQSMSDWMNMNEMTKKSPAKEDTGWESV